MFSTGISETVPCLFATGSSSASTWKLQVIISPPYHLQSFLLGRDPTQGRNVTPRVEL
jgi:hypothetical protein